MILHQDMASNQPLVITNSPTTAESMPLLTEAVELEENPPPCLKAKPSNTSNALDEMIQHQWLDTPYGSVHVALQGDPRKPAILTYHDIGMNYSSCFNSFLNDTNMNELLPLFFWIHIDAPGQEEDAKVLPEGFNFPSMTELAEQVGIIVEHFQLSYIIGIGVGAGANVLARYAILSPDRVRGLVLINLSPECLTWTNLSYYTNKLVGWLLKTDRLHEAVQKYFMSHSFTATKSDSDLTATYHQYYEKQNPHNLALFLESYSKRTPITSDFTEIGGQCLFVFHKNFEDAQDIIALSAFLGPSKSTTLEISSCGHLVLEEQPQKVATGFRLFLQGLGHAVTLGIQTPKPSSDQLHLQGVAVQ